MPLLRRQHQCHLIFFTRLHFFFSLLGWITLLPPFTPLANNFSIFDNFTFIVGVFGVKNHLFIETLCDKCVNILFNVALPQKRFTIFKEFLLLASFTCITI